MKTLAFFKHMKRYTTAIFTGLCIFLSAHAVSAADTSLPLNEEDVSIEKLKTFFDAAFMKTEFQKNGDLKIEDAGFKTFVRIDKKKKMITLYTGWGLKSGVEEIKKLQLINRLNEKLILVRFSTPQPTSLWCDYQFLYEGGITPYTIVNTYKYFAQVVKGAVLTQDPEKIIGSDPGQERQIPVTNMAL